VEAEFYHTHTGLIRRRADTAPEARTKRDALRSTGCLAHEDRRRPPAPAPFGPTASSGKAIAGCRLAATPCADGTLI